MKITPISNDEPSVAVAVVADEENVIPTKNSFDDADDEDLSSSSRSWSKCLIATAVAFLTALAVAIALPLIHNTRQTEDAALQMITFGMNNNQSGSDETYLYESIISNGRHGICSINEDGSDITYVPTEEFFVNDSCTYIVVVCSDITGVCDDPTEETITFSVKPPDAPITSPDVMVLVGREEKTETATSSVARLMSSTITTSSSITPAQTTTTATTATTSPDDEGGATFDATTAFVPTVAKIAANPSQHNPCSECSVTNDNNNFCGQLGIQNFDAVMDACESQTECEELGLQCIVCDSVEGFHGDVGHGAYICVEKDRNDNTADDTATTSTIGAATTAADGTTATTATTSAFKCSSNFRGQLGIYPYMSACESQTECEERGLQCIVCDSVDGYDGDVGHGAYVCVEEEVGDKTGDDTATTSTIAATTTTADVTTSTTTTTSAFKCSSNFRGQLGIYPYMSACESQTECEERGLQCIVCDSVDGYDGDVGHGAYVCVEEEVGDKTGDDTATTSTIVATTTTAYDTTSTTTTEAARGGIESLMGTKWKAEEIRWLIPISEELKETTEADRNPITLVFRSDTRVSGTCGNNRCSSVVSLRDDRLRFGKFRRTKMAASEQEQNYVYLLEETTFFYDVRKDGNGSNELDLYEIVVENNVEKRGRIMATYFQMENV